MPLEWSPFGGNPVPGDPGQVRTLAERFSDFVGQVGQQRSLLMDVHDGVGGIWMSPAGRAFSPRLGALPGQLQKLHTSYADAADALDAYWPELQDAQSMATTALAKVHAAIEAQHAAKAAQAQDYQAFQAQQAQLEQEAKHQANQTGLPVTFTLSNYSPSPAVVAQTDQANQAYQAAMSLKDQAVQKANTAAQRLSGRLDDASKAGIQNPHYGFFGGLLHDAESAFDDVSHWVGHHVGAIETVAAVAVLGPAGLLLTSDGRAMLHSALKAMNPVFEAVSGACGVVSFGLAIVGMIPGLGEVADVANEGVMGLKTVADLGMLADGDKGAVQNLEGDALGLLTGGESRLATGLDDLAGDSGTMARVVDDGAARDDLIGVDRGDGRDVLGKFTGRGGYGKDAEARGLDQYEADTGSTVVRRQVRSSLPEIRDEEGNVVQSTRYYDGLEPKPDGTYTGVEVKSGTAGLDPGQRAFDTRVRSGEPAVAKLNGKTIRVTSVRVVRTK